MMNRLTVYDDLLPSKQMTRTSRQMSRSASATGETQWG